MGYMTLNAAGKPFVSYELSPEQINAVRQSNFWHNVEDGIRYGAILAVMNLLSPAEIAAQLDRAQTENPRRRFVEIMIHEQYFYDDYKNYESDFEERIMAGCRWCCEHGMQGIFAEDAVRMY